MCVSVCVCVHVCVCLCVMSTAVVSRGGRGVMSPFCTAGMQDGTDGGGMRPVLTADLRSSLGRLSVCL